MLTDGDTLEPGAAPGLSWELTRGGHALQPALHAQHVCLAAEDVDYLKYDQTSYH